MLIRRDTIMTMSTANLIHNIKLIKKRAAKAKIIAAVKANAYGHGLKDAALRLEKYVDMLGVAFIDEAIFLRKNGIKIPFYSRELLKKMILKSLLKKISTWFFIIKVRSNFCKKNLILKSQSMPG